MALLDASRPRVVGATVRVIRALARGVPRAAAVIAVVGLLLVLVGCRQTTASEIAANTPTPLPPTSTPAPPTSTPIPPTSVTLSLSAPGLSPTTQSSVTIKSGTTVTLTVIPDHSLVPFQTYTMGIYAHDPYPFSELHYCKYPYTDTCIYTLAYSSSEATDYTKGSHTVTAFLGDIGGSISNNSNNITITWS